MVFPDKAEVWNLAQRAMSLHDRELSVASFVCVIRMVAIGLHACRLADDVRNTEGILVFFECLCTLFY